MPVVHLLVLVHGMWGSPIHLLELERMMLEVAGKRQDASEIELETLVTRANEGDSTYDGIDCIVLHSNY